MIRRNWSMTVVVKQMAYAAAIMTTLAKRQQINSQFDEYKGTMNRSTRHYCCKCSEIMGTPTVTELAMIALFSCASKSS